MPRLGGAGRVRIPGLKNSSAVSFFSEYHLFSSLGWRDSRYERKRFRVATPPTKEVWARYYAARNALRVLGEYEFTDWGGPDYATEVPEPSPTYETTYLETREEWLDRCRALYKGETT